jgi:hypothetical protein
VNAPTLSDILAGRGGPYFRVDRAPNGRAALVTAATEMRMSHWIEHAALYALPEERLIVSIGSSFWSADRFAWIDEGRGVSLDLRRYPGDVPGVAVTIDMGRGEARMNSGEAIPLADLSAALESDYFRRGGRG